jgi:predicted hotdog family 3-hydroxylacyl-ACP dehydratase
MVHSLLNFTSEKVVSSFTVLNDNLFIENKLLLEPGLVENMAQTVALHTGYDYFLKGEKAPTGYIGSIKTIIINQLPKVDDVIKTEATILHEFMGVTMVSVSVFNDKNEEIASGEMKTVIAN